MEDKKWCVYVHTNKINSKRYVGITGRKTDVRWGFNGNGYKGQVFFHAIDKHGWGNFEHEIITEGVSEQEAKLLEIELISKYNSNSSQYGYNVTGGGDGLFNPTDEIRKNISKRVSGEKNPMFGKTHTEEVRHRLKILARDRVGEKSPRYGKTFTREQKEKIRASLEGKFHGDKNHFYGEKHDYETRKRLSIIAIENNKKYGNNNAKTVVCNGKEFHSVKKCAEYYEVKYSKMVGWLLGNVGMPQEFVNMGLKYKEKPFIYKPETTSRCEGVLCGGEHFKTIKECAKYYEIKYTTMCSWIKGRCEMPQKFKDLCLAYYTEECKEIQD